MNRWSLLAVSLACVQALVAGCSGGSSNEPSGQDGSSGASGAAGNAASGGARGGSGGSASQGGSGHTAGSAGKAVGGSSSAGTTSSAGEAGSRDGEGSNAGQAPSGPYRAVLGELCPVESTIGVVELRRGPPLSVQVALYDGPDPWITEAELSNPTCDFHRYEAGGCPACETGEVCSLQGECVPQRRTIKNARLQVTTGSEQREYVSDDLGSIYSPLDIGDASSEFAMTLSWGETQVTLEPMPVASGELDEVVIGIESEQYDMPGALDASWQPPGDEAFVRSRIPINHHAGGPTFTDCRAPSSAGTFHADADMINPLAVHTGLEFQGLDHVFIAAASTPQGCVELRFGTSIYASPN